jgi:uncharacterized protein YcsI (UPF0317 family)
MKTNIFLELSLHFEMTIIVSLFKIIVTIGSVVQYWSSDYLIFICTVAFSIKKKLYRANQILRERESRTEPDWWNPPPWEDLSGNQPCHLWWVSQSSISLIDVRPLVRSQRPKPHGHDLVMGCSIVLDIRLGYGYGCFTPLSTLCCCIMKVSLFDMRHR